MGESQTATLRTDAGSDARRPHRGGIPGPGRTGGPLPDAAAWDFIRKGEHPLGRARAGDHRTPPAGVTTKGHSLAAVYSRGCSEYPQPRVTANSESQSPLSN